MPHRRPLSALCALVLSIAAAGAAHGAGENAALKALIGAADKEGSVNLSWSQSSLGGSQGASLFEAAMNKKFGTHIRLNFTPGPEMARIGNQLATEWQTHQPAHVDAFLGAAAQVAPLVPLKMFQAPDWRAYMPERMPAGAIEENGQFVRIATGLSGATYNSQLAPFKPKTLADFLDPRWKGKIASTPYAAGFDVLAADDVWGPKKTDEYVTKLSRQIAGLIRCGDAERLATGEFLALVMDCTGQEAKVWARRGAPLKQMMPLDAAQRRYYYMSVAKGAVHPNAAKLFVLFLLTPEGQALVNKTWSMDLHMFPDSVTRKEITAYEKQGVKFKDVTIPWWLSHPEIEKNKRALIKILTNKS